MTHRHLGYLCFNFSGTKTKSETLIHVAQLCTYHTCIRIGRILNEIVKFSIVSSSLENVSQCFKDLKSLVSLCCQLFTDQDVHKHGF